MVSYEDNKATQRIIILTILHVFMKQITT